MTRTGKTRRWPLGAYGGFLAALIATASAAEAQQPEIINLYINYASFDAAFGSANRDAVRRVVEHAAAKWSAEAGLNRHWRVVGSTTATSCTTHNVIWMDSATCGNAACTTAATYFQCGPTFEIRVFRRNDINNPSSFRGFSLGSSPASDQLDLQALLTHEFGHSGTWLHTSTGSDCVMSATIPLGQTSRRYFCAEDLELMRVFSYWGGPIGPPMSYAGSQVFPAPGSDWRTYQTSPSGSYAGVGGVDLFRGTKNGVVKNRIFRTNPSTDRVEVTPYAAVQWSSAGTFAYSRMRPTVAFDPVRERWWLFWRGTPNDNIIYSTASDPNGPWSNPVTVKGAGAGGLDVIQSRAPVAAAYDWFSDRIVVVFIPYTTNSIVKYLEYVTIDAGTPSGTWTAAAGFGTWSTTGTPALACENSSAAHNCQMLVMGSSVMRETVWLGFGLNGNGSLYSTINYGVGGYADHPIGLTYNGPQSTGHFVAAHRGLDGWLYIMSKARSSYAWPGWTRTDQTAGPMGTPISIDENYPDYHVFFTP